MMILYIHVHLIPETLSEELEFSREDRFAGFFCDIDEVFDIMHRDEHTGK